MIKEAMILAAGFGKRLNPLTKNCPKPLLKIGKETLLSNTLKFLEKYGIKKVSINVHYLSEQIVDYLNNNKFNLNINIIKEEEKILDTGGGILNAIKNFSKEPLIIINPDTVWNSNYLSILKEMDKFFHKNKKNKCLMLLAKKEKSFDQSLDGDFNLSNNLISKKESGSLKYIYTGLQIINPDIFLSSKEKVFPINKIWDLLIKNNELHGIESSSDFLHISTLSIYKELIKKNFKR